MRASSTTTTACQAGRTDRREFLRQSAVLAGAVSAVAAPWVIADDRVRGANERIGIGYIGTGGRAGAHIDIGLNLKQEGLCDTVAVCDVFGPRVRAAAEKTGGKMYRNYHELLADPRVDVVCIATPDRHHAQQAIDAVRAGKDVYCESARTTRRKSRFPGKAWATPPRCGGICWTASGPARSPTARSAWACACRRL